MEIVSTADWFFPPTTNKEGKSRHIFDKKEVIRVKSNLFSREHPVILMSDMHFHTGRVFRLLDEHLDLSKYVVLTVGDMSGDKNIFGVDGDPTQDYIFMAERAMEFYFVQGNHDLPSPDNSQERIKNNKDKFAMIQNGEKVVSVIGSIGGVNGTISEKDHPYKLYEETYIKFLDKCLNKKPEILLTHDTPKIHGGHGSESIYKSICNSQTKIHVYGHCHHNDFYFLNNRIHFICAEARIIIFEPVDVDCEAYTKKEITEEYYF